MHRYLESIVLRRTERVRRDKAVEPPEVLREALGRVRPPLDPVPGIRGARGFVIAEIKRASPSAGPIAMDVDPGDRAKAYALGGADAVSVLCEPDFFKGSRGDLRAAASAVDIPVLCKDFVVDPYQLLQAAVDGARWVLLIARILGESLDGMVRKALSLGLEPLVEVHCEKEMRRAIASRARVIGINARDLDTFRVDLDVPARLAACCPAHCACIAESGIRTVDDLLFLRAAGAHGFLVGETLMRRGDPENAILSFKNALSPDARESEAV